MHLREERLREQQVKARINLSQVLPQFMGLIILQPSGAFYTHETGGYACFHESAEGVFVPLYEGTEENQEGLLIAHFTGPKWEGWCDDGIDEPTAEYIDYVFSLSPTTNNLRVDRVRLDDCKEAWIYVTIREPGEDSASPISGFGDCKGVFVWGNSD